MPGEIFAFLSLVLLLVVAVLALFLLFFYRKFRALEAELSALEFKKQSQSVKYGKLTEQWIPFSAEFPFPAEEFRFIGSPVDGVAFTDDRIVFCEFKAAGSRLSEKQKSIKELVRKKMVEWLELKVS